MHAEQLFPALADLSALIREVREGLLTGATAAGFVCGAVALLALQSIFGRRGCDRCGR